MKASYFLRTLILIAAISFIGFYPLLPLENTISDDIFFLLSDNTSELREIRAAASEGNVTRAKSLLHNYFVNRAHAPYSAIASNNLTLEMQNAELVIRRSFTVNEETYFLYNCSEPGKIQVNGREILDTNWHRNPNTKDDEWIWVLSRWGWINDLARSYLGNIALGNGSVAEYYAEALVDLVTDFIAKEPVGSMYSWRTIDSAIRIPNAMGAMHAIKNSSAFTPDFCYIFLRFLVDHGRYLADFHKIQFNWAFIECQGLIELCAFLPEITEINAWQKIAWEQFEKSIDSTFYPDGGSKEQAINYHRVATGRLGTALLIAQQYPHLIAPSELRNKIVNMYLYIMYNTLPDYYSTTFGDSGQSSHQYELGKASQLFDNAELDYFDANGNPIAGRAPPKLNVVFPDSGVFISRSQWNDSNALYSFFDGGPFGEFYHAHYDFGSIEIAAFDRRWILDPGRHTYTMDEMSRYMLESYSHNVVLIDGQPQGKINPSSSSWVAGYLGSCAKASHNFYGAKLDRELLFANFRDNLTQDVNLTRPSDLKDLARYWVVSDFWDGSGTHDIAMHWQLPNFNPIFIDNASTQISQDEFVDYIRCLKSNYSTGNLGIYGFGPWTEMQNITGGDSATYGQPYGWYSPKMYVLEKCMTLRYLGNSTGPSRWFTVLYPAEETPNITINTPIFQYGGQSYQSGGLGIAPGNVVYIQHAQGAELHISLSEATSGSNSVELNLAGYKINFKGRQLTLHFNLTNHITQIFTQYTKELLINDVPLLAFASGILMVNENHTLNALTFGLDPARTVNSIYIGSKLVPPTTYIVENNAVNLGAFILGGNLDG